MIKFKTLFARALVALLFIGGTGAALAGPLYRVAIDTSTFSGTGYLDLTLTGLASALPVSATVSSFQGSVGSTAFTLGQVSGGVASTVTLAQGPSFNELLQSIDFGGVFRFDVRFDVPTGRLDGSNFGVALVDASLSAYAAGTLGEIGTIALMPGVADALWADGRFVSIVEIAEVAEIAEPGGSAIVALGLLLAAWSRARGRAVPGAVA